MARKENESNSGTNNSTSDALDNLLNKESTENNSGLGN